MTRLPHLLVLAAALLTGGVRASWAAAVSWDGGGGDGNWYTPANWSGDAVPGVGDDVTIDAAVTVTADASSPTLRVNSLTLGGSAAAELYIDTSAVVTAAITVSSGGTLYQGTTHQFRAGSMTMAPGGNFRTRSNTTTRRYVVDVAVTGDFDLAAGATISVQGRGYTGAASGNPGVAGNGGGGGGGGTLITRAGGAGAGHGGAGGNGGDGTVPAGGGAYETAAAPTDLGSGGGGAFSLAGSASYLGGDGGGAVILSVGGRLTLDGYVTANGSAGTAGAASGNEGAGGGGAGGTIRLSAATARGAGTLHARGGAGGADGDGSDDPGGGGGGGRIAVSVTGYNGSTWTYSLTGGAAGGGTAVAGAGGTAYPQPGGVTDLAAAVVSTGLGASSATVTLTWTAPAPGAAGALNNYDIRWATFPLSSLAFYNIATYATVNSTSLVAGVRQSTAIANIDAATTWYFAVTVSDLQQLRSDLSNGATVLAQTVAIADQGRVLDAAWGDYDGDGDLDAAAPDGGGGGDILRSDPSSFTALAPSFANARRPAWADYDRDGDLDVAFSAYGGDEVIARNDGGGAFTAVVLTGSGGSSEGLAWGDYDNDGDLDLAVANDLNENDYIARNNGDGTFSTFTLVGTGGNSQSVVWGDFDNDGDLDLVIVNSGANAVLVQSGGFGGLSTQTLAATSSSGRGAAAADYDGDGDLDVLVADAAGGGEVYLLRNSGAASFTAAAMGGTGPSGGGLAAGDLDEDGDYDAVITRSGALSAVLRNSAGSFLPAGTLPGTALTTNAPSLGDRDGDGDLDVLIGTHENLPELLVRNDGPAANTAPAAPNTFAASFAEFSVFSTSGTLALSWSGASDAESSTATLRYLVRLGTTPAGSQVVRVPSPFSFGGYGGSDGLRSDRLSASQRGTKVALAKESTGYWAVTAVDAGFKRSAPSAEQTVSLLAPRAVTDLAFVSAVSTGLGASTMAVTLTWTAPGDDGTAGTLAGTYDLRYATFPVDTQAGYLAAAQVLVATSGVAPGARQWTSVPSLDVLATWYFALTTKDAVGVRSGLSSGATALAYVRGYNDGTGLATGMAAGDLDGDGDADLLQPRFNGGAHQWRNLGGLDFTDTGTLAGTGNDANGVSVADLDRDGDLDAVVANTSLLDEAVLRNDGAGSFSVLTSTGLGESYDAVWGDFNNDGLPDFAVANYSNADEYVARNNGDGTFSTATLTGTGKNSLAAAWADYDQDGDLDLAIANDSGQDEAYARNNGDGTFSTFTLTGSAGNSTSLAWGDYDGDGDLDLAVGNGGGQDEILARNDAGTLTIVVPNPFAGSGGSASSLAWGDADGDGDLDLLVTNSSGQDAVYRNEGGGTFVARLLPGTAGDSEGGVWADLDGDGDLDVAVATRSATQLLTLRNDAALTLSSPTAPSAGFTASWSEQSVGSASGTLTLSWTAASDDTTPAAALLYRVRVGTSSGGSEFLRVPPANSERGRGRVYPDRLAAGSPGVRVSSVPKGGPVYWSVLAEDAGYVRGPASSQQTADLTPPAAVTLSAAQDLVLETSSVAWVSLTFNAPGENGASGDLQSGAVYDLRWSSAGTLDTLAKYAGAPNAQTYAAAGTAGAPVTMKVAVDPGKTWHFALTTKDSLGARSALSNAVSANALLVREVVADAASFALLQGQTTAFLRVKLWTEGGTADLLKLKVRKFGTLPDFAVSNVALFEDNPADGLFTSGDVSQLTSPAVFASSQATLTLSAADTLTTSTKTYFVVAALRPNFLPVAGASMALRLDGEAVTVRGAGFEGVDFPAFKFDGVDDALTVPYAAALDVGGGGQVTVEAWLRSTDTARANAAVISRGINAGNNGYRLWLNAGGCGAGVPSFFVGSSVLCAANGAGPINVADGRWHHVAAVYSALVGQFFVDGVALATAAMAGTLSDPTSYLAVGSSNASGGAANFIGELDEVRISNFVRYPAELPPSERGGSAGTVVHYHFDGLDPENLVRDASANSLHAAPQGQAAAYARSTGSVVNDIGDTLFAAATPLIPSAFFRNDQNVPVMKLQLWTGGDFINLDTLSVAATGSAAASSVNQIKLYLDNGDGNFSSVTDTPLTVGQSFAGGKATFSLLGAGASQALDTSTKTYFLAWNVSVGAQLGADMGAVFASTADFVLSGTVDGVSPAAFPLASGTAPIVAAQSLVSAETLTGTWLNVSSAVFRAAFGSGNIDHLHWRWDQAPATAVTGAESPVWSAGKTTVTATADAQNWYFHARAFDTFDGAGTQSDLGPFWFDRTAPAGSGFLSYNSTAGPLAETQFNDLAAGVTVQLTVSDAASGLNLTGPAPLSAGGGAAGLWHLDETAGPWQDVLATNTVAAVGAPAVGPGRFGPGLLLDGSAYAEKASASGLPLGAAARTLEAWVNQTATAGVQGVAYYGQATCAGGVTLALSSGVVMGGDGCTFFTAGTPLSTGAWHHVALTYDGSSIRLYADGAFLGSNAYALATAAGPLRLGQTGAGSQGLRGSLDEVKLSTHALTAGQVAAHAANGEPFSVSYSSDAGRSWEVIASTFAADGPSVALTGAHGTTAAQTLTASGLRFVVSTGTLTGPSGTNLVRFHYTDTAGNMRTSGPFTVLVDTNAPVAVSTPSLPAAGTYALSRPDFYWTGPSSGLVQGLGGQYFVEVSSADPSFTPPVVISVSTPATATDTLLAKGVGVYLSTFTLAEGATYYWRVRSRSSLGVFGPWGPATGFVVDAASPALSGFTVFDSTGGVFGEAGPLDLLVGVTVQMTASDANSGLGRPPKTSSTPATVAYWRFSERDGAAPVDEAGGIVGALTCSGACTPARLGLTPFGAGLKLSGNQYMSAPNTSFSFPPASTFTVSAWIRPNSVSVNQVIAAVGAPFAGNPNGGNWAFLFNTSGQLGVTNVTGGGVFSAGTPLAAGVWQHVAMVTEGGRVWFYVNGALRGAQNWSGNSGGGTMPFTVGAGVNLSGVVSGHFTGDLDEVRVQAAALTPAEVAAEYARGAPGSFAVEYSTTAGAAWNVVSATFAASGLPWVAQTGGDGDLAPQTLSARNLTLAQSTTPAVGSLGTNLLRFLSADRRGNFTTAGPFTVVVDTVAAAAVSTPTFPSPGVFVSTRPTFFWAGPSTATAGGLGAAAHFLLEVDDAADFLTPAVLVSTPVVATASSSLVTQGVYLSTFTLASGTTYYWRVRARDALGLYSPALTVTSFVTDFSSPTGSGFGVVSATGGLVGESVGISLLSGVTAQATIRDLGPAGLALNPAAGAASFGVMYTTVGSVGALAEWIDGTRGRALTMAGKTGVKGLTRHDNKLWLANAGNDVWSFDGSVWGLSNSFAAVPNALESFGGMLYAGLASGQVWRFDGASWAQAATLTGGSVRALRAFAGRLYAGDDSGRVWAYEPGLDRWYVATQSASVAIESLGVYDGRLFAGANPNIYVFNGTAWDTSFVANAAVNGLVAYDNRLFAATNNSGIVYQFDGAAWTTSLDPPGGENEATALAVHAGRLYAGVGAPAARLEAFDGRGWSVVRALPAANDRLAVLAAFGGRLYEGLQLGTGDAAVDVSTPLAVAVTGAEGTTAPQTIAVTDLALAQSGNANTCNGSLSCTATNMVRFTYSDRAGRVGQLGPFAVLADSLLNQPTTYSPADGSAGRETLPDFSWVEASTMPKHSIEISTASDFSALLSPLTPAMPVTGGFYDPTSPTLTSGTTYYWRVRGQSSLDVGSAFSAQAAFLVDTAPPSTASYRHLNSTGGVLSEAQITNLAQGATVELTLQDPLSGLYPVALESGARLGVYSFEDSGAKVLDASPLANIALLGATSLRSASGYQGGGLSFGGAAPGMTVSTAAPASWTGLSAGVWAKMTADNQPNRTLVASAHFRLQADSLQGRVRYRLDAAATGGCSAATPYAYPLGGWVHVAAVLDPALAQNRLYVNGVTAAACAGTASLSDTAFTVGIDTVSGIGSSDPFLGNLDEVRLFSAALSTAQVQAERGGSPLAVFFSTDAGVSWQAAASTHPAGPRLSFAAVPGATGAELFRVVDLPLRNSTNTVTCAQAAPCGATNQVLMRMPDRAGSVRTMGPFAVVVDTAGPTPLATSLTPLSTDQMLVTSTATDNLAGVRDFNFEASTSAAFALPVSSSGFVAQTSWTFTGLLDATTHFVRVWSRDQVLNVSTPSVSVATATFGTVTVTTAAAAPASALQGALVPLATLRLNTKAGSTSRLKTLTLRKTGTVLDAEVTAAKIYLEVDGDGVFSVGDTEQATNALTAGEAVLALAGGGAPVGVLVSTFHVVFSMSAEAFTNRTVGLEISSATNVVLEHPGRAFGPFPVTQAPIPVSDGANALNITPGTLAPLSAQPSTNDIPMLSLRAQTAVVATSVLSTVTVTLSGTLPPNTVRSVNVWRDADPEDGVFDANTDARMTSDSDTFGLSSTATLALSAFDVSSRTVTNSARRYFVTLSLASNAPQDATFQLGVATTAHIGLENPVDTVVFVTTPVVTSTVTVIFNNALTAAFVDETPPAYTQGDRYTVLRATLTVDAGAVQVNRFTLRRTGTGQDSDVASVEVWRDATADGKGLQPALDQRIGTAAFSGGLVNVAVTTQSLSFNATNVFFLAYVLNPAASPGVSLGARLLTGDVGVGNSGTTVLGAFPVDSATRTVSATVNHMVVVNAIQDVSPGALLQGQQHAAMLRLDVVSDKNDFSWLGLSVERLGTAPDAAVSAVNIFKDFDGNSVFDAAVDSRVTSGADVFSASTATLTLQQVQTLTSSTRTYFVTLSVAPLATPGQTLGLRISTSASFNLLAPNTLSAGTTFPMQTSPVPVNQFQNTVVVTTASIVPALGAEPGTSDVGLIALTLRTDVSNASWQSLRVDQAGTAADADVKAVKLYYDFNDVGTFNSSNLNQYSSVTYSTQTFGNNGPGSVILTFATPQTLSPTPKRYFLVVDLSTGATPARTVVVRASTGAFFSVDPPNQVAADSGFQSAALSVNAPPVSMFVTAGSSAPASVLQGTPNATMLTLKVRTNAYSARWTQLRVTRSGTGADGDVPAVKLYRDANGDGTLSVVADERLSTAPFSGGTALLTFATQTVTASTQTFFVTYDVKTTATAGNTVGARLAAAGDLRVASPDTVSTAGFPLQSVNSTVTATQAGLFVTPVNLAPGELKQAATEQVLLSLSLQTTQFALTWSALTVRSTGSAADADIKALSLWHDADLNGTIDAGTDTKITSGLNAFLGGTAVLSLSIPQEIGTSIKRYLVAADIASFAEPGRTFAVVLASTASFAVSAPNFVVNANFPAQSDANATLRKLEESLVVTPADLVSTGINQGALKALARLDVRASRNRVGWTSLVVRQNGNLGAGEIDKVGVWRDVDSDGAVGAADFQVGTAAFSGSLATVLFSSAQTVGVATQSYLLAAQPNLSATVGADIRLSVQSADFAVTSPDAVLSSSLPFTAGSAVVLDAKTPSQPVVTDAGGFSGDFEGLDFSWVSTVGTGSIVGASYAVGTTAGGTDVRGWTALAASETSVRAKGFPLLQATTYYVAVRTQSSFGIDSPVGLSNGILMDFSPPSRPVPTVTTGSGSLLVTWGSVAGGPSGILGYLVEYRTGASPQWFNAKTGVKTTVLALGDAPQTAAGAVAGTVRLLAVSTDTLVTGSSFQAGGLPSGTLFVRVRSVTGSGVLSTASDPVQVQLGALPKDGLTDASVYPNPFDSRKQAANIHYVLSQAAEVSMKVYTVFGRTIRETSFTGAAGSNTASWDGADQDGRKVSKGLYIMVLQSGGAKATLKVGVIH